LKAILLLSSGLFFLLLAGTIGFLVRDNMQQLSLEKARQEAKIILTHNLAIHTYFSEHLKPAILPLVKEQLATGYFDPAWMSSTFAVRQIEHATENRLSKEIYYKECAINARSPQNEADAVERDFLLRLNQDPKLEEETEVRKFEGAQYYVVMRRGETLESTCMMCHSTPEEAPQGLVALYGSERSFHRQVGDTISAVSIRIPLSQAYADVLPFSWRLTLILSLAAGLLLAIKHLLYDRLVLKPVQVIRNQARRIATDEQCLGETLPVFPGREFQELAGAFNTMSGNLKLERDSLETRVEERTAALQQAVEDLQLSEERYRTLNRSMIQPMALHEVICDSAGVPVDYCFLDVNPAFETLMGKSSTEIVGRTVRELLPVTEEYWIETYGQVALTGQSAHFQNYSQALDRHFDVVAFSPRAGQFAVVATDITARVNMIERQRSLEQQMLHAQKLESLGVLAGGIAHDFNNILMAVLGNADLALMRLAPESPAVENLRQIEKAAGQATDLARQMLAYSGKGRFVIEPLNLNSLVEEMLHILKVSISKQAVLRFNYSPHLPTIEADATQVRQILMNLVINASEAIGERSGVIAISTGMMDCDRQYLQGTSLDEELPEGMYVYTEVADTGCGMDKETLSKLFDPFFSTKFTGRGLGMAAVLGIIRGHHGAIKVYSEPDKGTTFKVLFPASTRAETLYDLPVTDSAWRGSGTILLVDDEETVRAVGKDMLVELGYTVVTAADGREALKVFAEQRANIACVLMDLTMPHMDGEQAFRELRRIDPTVKIIMASGYNEQEVSQKFLGKGLSGFLQKPFRISTLRATLQNLEEQPSSD
jgi:PAS domain S-box-containing protein